MRRRGRWRPHCGVWSRGVDAIQLEVEELFGRTVVQNFPRQAIDAIGKEANIVRAVVGNALALGDKTPQHSVVALVGALLPRRTGVGEVHLQLIVSPLLRFTLQLSIYIRNT